MNIPRELRFTETHEWIRAEDDGCTIGITDFAQTQLSDVTYVELPEVGEQVNAQDELAVLESVKAASDIYAPFAGVVTAINEMVVDNPELINVDPYGEGWLFKIEPENSDDVDALLDADQYEQSVPNE